MTVSTDPIELLVSANGHFADRLCLVRSDDWRRPTPCSEWDVRALVNHVVGTNVRQRLLLHGAPTEQVEATRSVDHLGDHPMAAFQATADRVVACYREPGALERIAHHASGDRTGRELLSMRILDLEVHSWDLARAIGADEALTDEHVTFLLDYTSGLDLGPHQRAFAAAVTSLPPGTSPQDELLHRLGRDPNTTEELR